MIFTTELLRAYNGIILCAQQIIYTVEGGPLWGWLSKYLIAAFKCGPQSWRTLRKKSENSRDEFSEIKRDVRQQYHLNL